MDYNIHIKKHKLSKHIFNFFKNDTMNIEDLQTYFPNMEDYNFIGFNQNDHKNCILNSRYIINNLYNNYYENNEENDLENKEENYLENNYENNKENNSEITFLNNKFKSNVFDTYNNNYLKGYSFLKTSSILEPISLMKNEYSDHNKIDLPFNRKFILKRSKKILNKNNTAYIDAFCTYLLSKLVEDNICPHFPLYHGNFIGISKYFYANISDEYDIYKDHKWFKNSVSQKKFDIIFINSITKQKINKKSNDFFSLFNHSEEIDLNKYNIDTFQNYDSSDDNNNSLEDDNSDNNSNDNSDNNSNDNSDNNSNDNSDINIEDFTSFINKANIDNQTENNNIDMTLINQRIFKKNYNLNKESFNINDSKNCLKNENNLIQKDFCSQYGLDNKNIINKLSNDIELLNNNQSSRNNELSEDNESTEDNESAEDNELTEDNESTEDNNSSDESQYSGNKNNKESDLEVSSCINNLLDIETTQENIINKITNLSYTSIDNKSESCDKEIIVYAKLNNVPVDIIITEHLDGTLENLLIKDKKEINKIKNTMLISKYENEEFKTIEKKWLAYLWQIIFGLAIAQKYYKFTHNDLHSNNVMYKETDIEYLYYNFNNKYYKIPTYGYILKIIDFGRGIFKINDLIYFSDVFQFNSEAGEQYTYPFEKNSKIKGVYPNMSFDLSRLSTSIIDDLFDDCPPCIKNGKIMSNEGQHETISPLFNILYSWITDKNGELVNKYDDFNLYKVIARRVNSAIPKEQLLKDIFNIFIIDVVSKNDIIYKYETT